MLVERDALLAGLSGALDDALAGNGRIVLVTGEAGAGKTCVARAFAETAQRRCRVRWGGADDVTTADAFAALEEAVPEIRSRLDEGGGRIDIYRALLAQLSAEPCLVVLDDLHWADEATLDALRFLARRIAGAPLLVLATYREEEVCSTHPLMQLLGDAATDPRTQRLVVPPLTVRGVEALVSQAGAGLDPVTLHARTDGNAFFVSELLRAGTGDLPATVADVVLARYARLPAAAQEAAAAAAILGTVPDASLIATVAAVGLEAVDTCLDEGVLVAGSEGIGFRHELARLAVEGGLSAIRARQLHRRALREIERLTPEDHRRIAHHAGGCGDNATAAAHAATAARRAASLGAHREAAIQYRTALRLGITGPERAELFIALSYECYLTDQLPEAISARQRALELHDVDGDRAAIGADERWLSRLSWFLGRGTDAERYATRAIASLEWAGPSVELAMAYSNLAQLRMLAGDNADAAPWGERALAMATQLGDVETQAHALNNLGAAAAGSGRIIEGTARLHQSLDIALAADMQEHAARAYTNLGSVAVSQRRYDEGLRELSAGIQYCEERDLGSWVRYMQAWQSTALADLGRFDDALAVAAAVLEWPGVSPVSAIPAAAVSARIIARRGDDPAHYLSVTTSLASQTGELQRIAPAACAVAEDAWLRGASALIGPQTQIAWELALTHHDPWTLGELAWWRTLGGIAPPASLVVAEPYAFMLQGNWDEAASAWRALQSPIWTSYSATLHPDSTTAGLAVRTLDALGAEQAAHALLRTRREHGLAVPRRPRAAVRAQPGQLTAREVDVLRALGRGMSTAEIAEELVVSPRTVEHHVSAVLRKLGEPTRARAVATAMRSGLLELDSLDGSHLWTAAATTTPTS